MKKMPRNKTVAKATFLMLVILITTTNCDNEIDVGPPEIEPKSNSFSIEDARSWFESRNRDILTWDTPENFGAKSQSKAKSSKRHIPLRNDWTKAFSSKRGHEEVVEVPLEAKGLWGHSSQSSHDKYKATGDIRYLLSLSRLIIVKNKKEGSTYSYIMTMIANTTYLESKNYNLFQNTYFKKDHNFGGTVLFHTLDGNFVNGWEFTGGKVTGKLTMNESNVSAKNSVSSVSGGVGDNCTTYYITESFIECEEYYTIHLYYNEYHGQTCSYIVEYDSEYTICDDDGSESGSGASSPTQNVNNKLQTNPNLLIDIDCDQIEEWQAVIQQQPKGNSMQKLWEIDQNTYGDIDIQTIEDAAGIQVNLDYFPVHVAQLPINPANGIRFTAAGFLDHIRTNMNDFVDTSLTSFTPSTITDSDEGAIWNSNNPETAVIHLNIPPPVGDGSVMCIESNPDSWTFTTLEVPYNIFVQGADGEHPVSGNREFGFEDHGNGTYTFYTRGVDRINDEIESAWAETFLDDPFEDPDALWNSYVQGIYDFVETNSGNSSQPHEMDNVINRPDWDRVKEVLLGNAPISELGCLE